MPNYWLTYCISRTWIEELMAEKENLEEQIKSASQLTFAAHLASNAKLHMSEEVLKRKQKPVEWLEAHAEPWYQLMLKFSEGNNTEGDFGE